jgi:glycosyltransferase involved in cell wall biosynthesis
MSAKKILILTASHLCRNPRVVKEATTLGAAGYDVTVMSVSTQDRFRQMDLALLRGLPFRLKVLDYAANTPRARAASFVQRTATWVSRLLCRTLHFEFAQSLGPAAALLNFARAHPADLTIVHTEIPIWAAQYLLREGRRVAVDVEDWYSEDLLFADRRSRPLRLLRRAEQVVLRHAAYASATSNSMSAALAEAYGCARPIVLRNTFPLQPVSRVDRPPGNGPPSFIWFSQTIGPGRGLELFFSAWSLTRHPSRVHLLGDVRADYRQHLLSRVPESRRADIRFIPLVTPDELPFKLAEFDLGLALEPHWPRNRDITITNKITQYMNAGLAVISTDTAGQCEVMHAAPDCGLLIQAHETNRLAVQLDELLGDRDRLRNCQLAARSAAVTQFNWAHAAPRLLAAVDRALATPAIRPDDFP